MSSHDASSELDLGTELETRILSIWRNLTRLTPSELSRSAASVLASLRDDGPQRITQLATHENIAQPSMSAMIQRLERRGLVERQPDPEDRRACRIAITASGEQLMRARHQARSRWLEARLSGLDHGERDQIVAGLRLLDELVSEIEVGA